MAKPIPALLLALIVGMAMPAAAQGVQIKGTASEIANGATVRWQSGSLKAQLETPSNTLSCTSSEFEGAVTKNQGEPAELTVTKTSFTGCAVAGRAAHVTSNAAEKSWTLQLQPAEASGQFTAHLDPTSGSSIQFSVKIQELGFTVATCNYTASTVQFMGEEGSDVLHIEGSGQLSKESASGIAQAECGKTGTLEGESQLESNSGEAITAVGPESVKFCEEKKRKCPLAKTYPGGTVLEASLKAKALSRFIYAASKEEVTCGENSLEAVTNAEAGFPLPVEVLALKFGNCNAKKCKVEALKLPYENSFTLATSVGNGSLIFVGKETPALEIDCGGGDLCKFEGTVKLRIEGGSPTASLYAENELLNYAEGNKAKCGGGLLWNLAEFTATAPAPLFISEG